MANWKDIPGYEGLYQVSTDGKVRSLDRYIVRNGCRSLIRGREIKPQNMTSGYLFVGLSRGGRVAFRGVHRLMALAFIQNPESKEEVNHKNGVKKDNRIENLEWVTKSENQKHAYDVLLRTLPDRPNKKPIRVFGNGIDLTFPSIREMCRELGFTTSRVFNTLSGKKKHYFKYTFELIKN